MTLNKELLLEELVFLQTEYIGLLGNELDETALIAAQHGWKSRRAEQGEKLRQQMQEVNGMLKRK